MVWTNSLPSNNEIFYTRSTDGGASFGSTINISNNPGNSLNPSVAASGNNVYVMWVDQLSGPTDIISRTSTDGGTTFESEPSNVSANNGSSGGLERVHLLLCHS